MSAYADGYPAHRQGRRILPCPIKCKKPDLLALSCHPGPHGKISAGALVVEEVQPGPVAGVLVGRAVLSLVQAGGVVNIIKDAGMDIGSHSS